MYMLDHGISNEIPEKHLFLLHCLHCLHLNHSSNCHVYVGSWNKQRNSRKASISASLFTLTVWITTNQKILKEMGLLDHIICLLRNLYAGQETTVRTEQRTTDWFKLGKGYDKDMYCHPAYLTSMQSTSWEMLDWMNHKLESRLPGEISTASDMQMIL